MNTQPRYDMYAFVHKGLRFGMSRSLLALSTVDTLDDGEFDQVAEQVQCLLEVCISHVHHENDFVHTAMEAGMPGSSQEIAAQHEEHEKNIRQLQRELTDIQNLPSLRRAERLHRYYRDYALWVADNFIHMEQEEMENNAVLWRCYSDAELIAIEQELVANIDPELMPVIQSLMLQAMTPAERAEFLGGLRNLMPAEVFSAVVEGLQSELSPAHYSNLLLSLEMSETYLAEAV